MIYELITIVNIESDVQWIYKSTNDLPSAGSVCTTQSVIERIIVNVGLVLSSEVDYLFNKFLSLWAFNFAILAK